MKTSPLIGFYHSEFGCLWGCHDEDGNIYFFAKNVIDTFGLTSKDLKQVEKHLLPGKEVGRSDLGDFITEEGLFELWSAHDTFRTYSVFVWLTTMVFPIIRNMKVLEPPPTYTTGFKFWTETFVEFLLAYVFVSISITLILNII